MPDVAGAAVFCGAAGALSGGAALVVPVGASRAASLLVACVVAAGLVSGPVGTGSVLAGGEGSLEGDVDGAGIEGAAVGARILEGVVAVASPLEDGVSSPLGEGARRRKK